MIFTVLLTLWNSEQKNGLLIKLFCFSSDFDETWWSCSYRCVLQFHQVSSKSNENKKVLLIARFSVQIFKVSIESWKSYIVWGCIKKKVCMFCWTGLVQSSYITITKDCLEQGAERVMQIENSKRSCTLVI